MRVPARRAIFHFISQTLFRVERYRIYLVMYAGLCVSLIASTVVRMQVEKGRIHLELSADGIRAAIPMAAFLIIAGLRVAFVSPGESLEDAGFSESSRAGRNGSSYPLPKFGF